MSTTTRRRRPPTPAERRAQLEARRLAAAERFERGQRPAQVARELGVSRQSASSWHADWTQGGVEALRSKGRSGPPPRLSDRDLEGIRAALLEGAAAHGFTGDLWTLARIASLIEQRTGVRLHPGYVWVILRQRMGFSLQRPVRRAVERDHDTIARWVAQEWPRSKQTPVDAKPE
jgi:transposase